MIMGGDNKMTFSQIKTALDSVEDIAALEAQKQQTINEFQSAPIESIMNRGNSRVSLKLIALIGSPNFLCRQQSSLPG